MRWLRCWPVYSPGGNRLMPSVRALFDGTHGVYRYLGEFSRRSVILCLWSRNSIIKFNIQYVINYF